MDEVLYLEADEEITSVVDKLKGLEAQSIGLVAPKGSAIVQSLVSLRLLRKEAEKLRKDISIITSDEVGRNLASQAGLPIFADIKSRVPLSVNEIKEPLNEPIEIDMTGRAKPSAEKLNQLKKAEGPQAEEALSENVGDFKVHRYDEGELGEQAEEKAEELAPKVKKEEKEEGFVSREIDDAPKEMRSVHEIEAERPIREPQPSKPVPRKLKYKRLLIIGSLAFLFLLIVVMADLVFARVTVKLGMPAEEVQKDVEVTVEKDRQVIDFEKNIIGGVQSVKEKSVEKVFKSTGEKDAGEAAKGTLNFRNEAGVDEAIAAGTTVTSTTNIGFTLDSAITVPKAVLDSNGDKVLGQTTGAVTAKNPGSGGNMPSSMAYIASGKPKISASGATSGGVTRKLKVVSKSDIDKAKSELKSQGEVELTALLAENKAETYVEGSGLVEIDKFESSKNAGDEAEEFSAKATVRMTVITFKADDLRQVVVKSVEKTLEGQDKSLLSSDTDTLATTLKEGGINVGKMVLNVNLKSHVGRRTDLAALSRSLRFKRIKTVRQKVSEVEGATLESVDLVPSFALPVSPVVSRNIKINIEYSQE
ncbi:MAG: baseplate J/gp47 family protein [Candidatus Berkelbacteria bacterium]|nr:baseplate J/gp47 family protein [Candidatus Berkelbacteria bacterium]